VSISLLFTLTNCVKWEQVMLIKTAATIMNIFFIFFEKRNYLWFFSGNSCISFSEKFSSNALGLNQIQFWFVSNLNAFITYIGLNFEQKV
jgi:hypothetical protein